LELDRKAMIQQHVLELKKQILINEEKKNQDKRNLLEEGKKIKDKLRNEKRTLEEIKHQKIEGLKAHNIPDKYIAELTKKKITI